LSGVKKKKNGGRSKNKKKKKNEKEGGNVKNFQWSGRELAHGNGASKGGKTDRKTTRTSNYGAESGERG